VSLDFASHEVAGEDVTQGILRFADCWHVLGTSQVNEVQRFSEGSCFVPGGRLYIELKHR
jgi:hypothetical protein